MRPIVMSRFIINFRQAHEQEMTSCTTENLSKFSDPNFRTPTTASMVDDTDPSREHIPGEAVHRGDEDCPASVDPVDSVNTGNANMYVHPTGMDRTRLDTRTVVHC